MATAEASVSDGNAMKTSLESFGLMEGWIYAALDSVPSTTTLIVLTLFFTGFLFVRWCARRVVRLITSWSLDDGLRLLFDPQQLATQLVGFTTLSVSLYTIPTTIEQRAQVFQQAGLLPQGDTALEILHEPGGWMQLLSSKTQEERKSNEEEEEDPSMTQEPEEYFPYSVSPIYREKEQEHHDRSIVEVNPTPPLLNEQQEPLEMLGSILLEYVRKRLRISDDPVDGSDTPIVLGVTTALVSSLALLAQLRYSATARAYCKVFLHLMVTTLSGTLLGTSLLGMNILMTGDRRPLITRAMVQQVLASAATTTRLKGTLLVLVLALFRYKRRQGQ